MKKIILLIMCIISLFITIAVIFSTYSRYAQDANANLELTVGKWKIKLNDMDVTQNNTYNFEIKDLIITENENVISGKIAPGLLGYFDINIDPTDTNVSVRYNLTINTQVLENSNIKIVEISETSGNTLIRTDENTYTGVILLEDIKKGNQNTIRIKVAWENLETEGNGDMEFAKKLDFYLKIPISMQVIQYTGE